MEQYNLASFPLETVWYISLTTPFNASSVQEEGVVFLEYFLGIDKFICNGSNIDHRRI